MHEYSVVQALLNQCEEVAAQNDATKVTKVITKIGVMSGIETHLLQTAFDTFKEGTICAEAEFIQNVQKL
ncbi:hydrogenase maturation nickel metallochaperone HypA, partial [Sulfurovum lithotrophicum]